MGDDTIFPDNSERVTGKAMCLDSAVFLIGYDAAVLDALSISLCIAGLKVEAYPSGIAFLLTAKIGPDVC